MSLESLDYLWLWGNSDYIDLLYIADPALFEEASGELEGVVVIVEQEEWTDTLIGLAYGRELDTYKWKWFVNNLS